MKYKYNGVNKLLVSSKSKLITLNPGDEVEFDDADLVQLSNKFVQVEKKIKKDKESEE